MGNFFKLIRPGGFLYGATHTPSFPLHRYPRDYCRFHHDWFEDLPAYTNQRYGVPVKLIEMRSYGGHVIFCYRVLP
jgi:hypothetical protein